MNHPDEMIYPHYAIVGLRPVKVVKTLEGGLDVLVFDWKTGELVRDLNYLVPATMPTDQWDVEWLSEEEFDRSLAELRAKIMPSTRD